MHKLKILQLVYIQQNLKPGSILVCRPVSVL